MAKIKKILYNGLYILPETVTDAVLDNNMERTLTKMLDDKLSSTEDDTAHGKITLAGGAVTDHMQSTTYTSGFGGKGYEIKMEDGKSYLTVDNAYFRNKATFDELEIREVTHTAGVEIKSPASCTVAEVGLYYPSVPFVDADGNELYASDGQFLVVSSAASGYKCFFKASDGEKTIYNDWRVGDLALCHEFNLTSGTRYYHRRVLAVSAEPEEGYHWVALSETDAQGTDTPIKGDTIVCFGSNIADRQNAIVLASNGDNAPYFAQLKGLDSFAISEENYITLLSPERNIIKGDAIYLRANGEEKSVAEEISKNAYEITKTNASMNIQNDKIESIVSSSKVLYEQFGGDDLIANKKYQMYNEFSVQDPSEGNIFVYRLSSSGSYVLPPFTLNIGDRIHSSHNIVIYECDGDVASIADLIEAAEADEDLAHDLGGIPDSGVGGLAEKISHQPIIVESGTDFTFGAILGCYVQVLGISDPSEFKLVVTRASVSGENSISSQITQTADNIRMQVGEAGINLDSKVITLDASKTIVTGDLAVSVVKTYWDAAQTQLKSAYNGNGEGTIVYYYPNGRVMKEDKFVSDTSGNIIGMRTTYYKANGEVAWVIDEGGFLTTLPDYWEVLNNGNTMCYSDSEASMMDILTQYLGESMKYFSKDKFSRFVGKSQQYKNYNGKVSKAVRSSENPTDEMLWAGVLVYSVELYKDGRNPTYIVTYEVCTTKLGQVGAIVTKKFNNLGEIS